MSPRDTNEPVHDWFELSYASYLVLPRSILQSAPLELQRRLVAVLDELDLLFEMPVANYKVSAVNGEGKFMRDPLRDYERGRRRISTRETAGQ